MIILWNLFPNDDCAPVPVHLISSRYVDTVDSYVFWAKLCPLNGQYDLVALEHLTNLVLHNQC